MYLILNYVEDNFARSIISADVLKAGEVVKIKGLADDILAIKSGVGLVGECYEVENNVDDANELFVLVAPDNHRYDQRDMWNKGDIEDVPAKEAVRGYICHKGMAVSVEYDVIEGAAELAVEDKLCVKAGSHKLTRAEGTENAILFKVLGKFVQDGRNMVKIVGLK